MTIKHLVISGGGPAGFLTYGAARHLAKEKLWKLEDIESIYCCSIGAFMGVIISLGYDWEWIDDYFIKRPWEKTLGITAISFLKAYTEKGIVGDELIHNSLEPLLTAKELTVDTTMAEFYEFNGIDIHIYSTNLNTQFLTKIDISHTSHPDMPLIKAIRMTTAYPFAFKPVCEGGDCFIDGGLLNNLPLNDCIEQTKCNKDEILAFKNIWITDNYKVSEDSSLIDYLYVLLIKMKRSVYSEDDPVDVKYMVRCLVEDLDGFEDWIKALATKEMRGKLIERGSSQAKLFLSYINSQGSVEKL
jgi:predicted acylesterase/phospholipase RssA